LYQVAPIPKSLLNFFLKQMAGLVLVLLQREALKIKEKPEGNAHVQCLLDNAPFYNGWLKSRLEIFLKHISYEHDEGECDLELQTGTGKATQLKSDTSSPLRKFRERLPRIPRLRSPLKKREKPSLATKTTFDLPSTERQHVQHTSPAAAHRQARQLERLYATARLFCLRAILLLLGAVFFYAGFAFMHDNPGMHEFWCCKL
jgi:hypothetical protein